MELNEYQSRAMETAIYPGKSKMEGLIYTTLGLASEAGEFCGKLKKVLRDNEGALLSETREAMMMELFDVLWYTAAIATELGMSLSEVARRGFIKLEDRKKRGVIGGDGDNR